jgi:TPR repeat protein/uncharacterized caspase-like protein
VILAAFAFALAVASAPCHVLAAPANPAVKLALVVGAGAYVGEPLKTPPADAALIRTKLLSDDGFSQVTILSDGVGEGVTQLSLQRAVGDLAADARLRAGQGGDVTVLFYFAGHGVEIDGESRLLPTSAISAFAPHTVVDDVERETVSAQWVLDTLTASGASRVVIVLDACRNNPFLEANRGERRVGPPLPLSSDNSAPVVGGRVAETADAGASRGLGRVSGAVTEAPSVDTMIMFSAAPRRTAEDSETGTGHSPFANALAVQLGVPGLSVREMFENVRGEVAARTHQRQRPDVNGVFEYALLPSAAHSADQTNGDEYLRAVLKSRPLSEIAELAGEGDGFSEWMLGVAYLYGLGGASKDEVRGAGWVRKAVAEGVTRATVTLGYQYHHGLGVAQSDVEGEAWDRVGADQGIAVAMSNLGYDYQNGWGVTRDPAQAAAWYRKAADLSFPLAEYHLAVAYENGQGVAQDTAEALRWYGQAFTDGDASSAERIARIYEDGRGVAPDPKAAQAWRLKAFERTRQDAEAGDAVAQRTVGFTYAYGLNGVAPDQTKADMWLQRAAAQGDAQAIDALAASHS